MRKLAILVCCMGLVFGFVACNCGAPPGPDGQKSDGKITNPDGNKGGDGSGGDSKTPPEPEGCPKSWTGKLVSAMGDPLFYAVFCPPPTNNGCHSLGEGPACVVANQPLIQFSYNPTSKEYAISHSGSIEENSHGTLKTGTDPTKPDQVTGLPENTKIRALFSGVPISFQFKGEEVTVFEPE